MTKRKWLVGIAASIAVVTCVAALAIVNRAHQPGPKTWSCPSAHQSLGTKEQITAAISTPPTNVPPLVWDWGKTPGDTMRFAGPVFNDLCTFLTALLNTTGLQQLTINLTVGKEGQKVKECANGPAAIAAAPSWCLAEKTTLPNGESGFGTVIIIYAINELYNRVHYDPLEAQLLLIEQMAASMPTHLAIKDDGAFGSCVAGVWLSAQVQYGNVRMEERNMGLQVLSVEHAAAQGANQGVLMACLDELA